jgi:hypothetical protein
MVRKRHVALTLIGVVLGGALTAVPPRTAGGTAGAISNSHHWIDTSRNSSLDIENAVKIELTCSGVTGAYSLVVSGVNMVNGSGVSFAGPSGDTALVLYQPATNFIAKISMDQSATNGLWQANSIGIMAAGDCTRGLPLILIDHADWVSHAYFPAVQIYGQLA